VRASNVPKTGPAEWVVRFDSFGPIRFGMTLDQMRSAAPGGWTAPKDSVCDYVKGDALPEGAELMIERGRVVRVDVERGNTSTAEGARIGDSEEQIAILYPGRVTEEPHKYTDGKYLIVAPPSAADTIHRLIFETGEGKVTVFRAGLRPQVSYVEGCS
jgi:hypothetical protein